MKKRVAATIGMIVAAGIVTAPAQGATATPECNVLSYQSDEAGVRLIPGAVVATMSTPRESTEAGWFELRSETEQLNLCQLSVPPGESYLVGASTGGLKHPLEVCLYWGNAPWVSYVPGLLSPGSPQQDCDEE